MSLTNSFFLLAAVVAGTAACLGPLSRGGRPPTEQAESLPRSIPEMVQNSVPAVAGTTAVKASTGPVRGGSRFSLPLDSARVLSPYGRRGRRFHAGIDLAHSRGGGDPIRAAAEGVVIKVSHRGGYGRMVLLRHADGWRTRYAHLRRVDVKVGQEVARGQTLGLVGDTGRATAPHLHFEILTGQHKAVDPAHYLFPKSPSKTALRKSTPSSAPPGSKRPPKR